MNFRQQLLFNLGANPLYQPYSELAAPRSCSVKLVAYYLPQFHPIPENDEWWGKGFTEWTNTTRAVPRYAGQYQPHLPGELGFYDLRMPEILLRQAELARHYGIHGFCFHYYWFGGRRILETPLANLLAHPEIDLPFCINWANESWSRTWDLNPRTVLLQQCHSADDDMAFAAALEPVLCDPRYIKVGDRPLIMVYRPALMPDAAVTVRRWRDHFRARGIGDPLFVMAQSFAHEDPRDYGFDAAAEFPPHKVGWRCADLSGSARLFASGFKGRIHSYDEMAGAAMQLPPAAYPLFRGVCPSWDNEARRPDRGVSFANSSPPKYAEWLEWACRKAMETNAPDQRIVFINAWNEWAEGAHLEPDRHYGYAYLQATADVMRVLADAGSGSQTRCIVSGEPSLPASQMKLRARAKAELKRRLPVLVRLRQALRRKARAGQERGAA